MMKQIILTTILALAFISCTEHNTSSSEEKQAMKQAYQEHSPTAHHLIAIEVIQASKAWITAFNNGDVETCLKGYDTTAIMRAMPFGLKTGKHEINAFWAPFIASGATDLVYTKVGIEVVNEHTAFLSANWSMNVGRGIIFQEKWEKKNGIWSLTYDDFEVLEQFKTPKKSSVNPIASHLALIEVIEASIEWINGFNTQQPEVCKYGYVQDAMLNAVPFSRANSRKEIGGFWEKLIHDGAKNLTYHHPVFKDVAPNRITLSSDWSMNIGEGEIFQEKWIKEEGKWLLDYDEFQVVKQY